MSLWGIIISKFSFDFWSPGNISGHVCMRFSGLGLCGWGDPPSLWAVPCLRLRSSPEWREQWAVPRCSVARCHGCLPSWRSSHEGLSLPLMLTWWGYSVIRHLSNASTVGGHRKNDFPQAVIYMGKFHDTVLEWFPGPLECVGLLCLSKTVQGHFK